MIDIDKWLLCWRRFFCQHSGSDSLFQRFSLGQRQVVVPCVACCLVTKSSENTLQIKATAAFSQKFIPIDRGQGIHCLFGWAWTLVWTILAASLIGMTNLSTMNLSRFFFHAINLFFFFQLPEALMFRLPLSIRVLWQLLQNLCPFLLSLHLPFRLCLHWKEPLQHQQLTFKWLPQGFLFKSAAGY